MVDGTKTPGWSVAQAALDRSRGGILPLNGIEELSMLVASADDPDEIPVPVPLPQLNVPSFEVDVPAPEPRVNQSAVSHGFLYSQGMALRKRGVLQRGPLRRSSEPATRHPLLSHGLGASRGQLNGDGGNTMPPARRFALP